MILKFTVIFVALVQLTFCSLSFGYSSGEVTLSGKVKALDEKDVKISSNNSVYLIPRKFILLSEIKPGQTIIVDLTKDQFASIKKIAEKKK